MARQSSERNIPHIRDIYGFHGDWTNSNQEPGTNIDARMKQTQSSLWDMKINDCSKEKASGNSPSGNAGATSTASKTDDNVPKIQNNKNKKQRSRRDNSRTLTEKDVKHLERHLSMKKTIRKKIMRDLQQAFVEDPNEFKVEDIPPEQLKAEINIQSLSFGTPSQKSGKKTSPEPNFLDMLRGGTSNSPSDDKHFTDDSDSGHRTSTQESYNRRTGDYQDEESGSAANKKSSFWRKFTIKGRNKR